MSLTVVLKRNLFSLGKKQVVRDRSPIVALTEGGKRLTPVERVLRQAALLDIPVEQTTRGEETTTWVGLTKAIDNRHRKLIRSLMGLGFEYWPGKGYWR